MTRPVVPCLCGALCWHPDPAGGLATCGICGLSPRHGQFFQDQRWRTAWPAVAGLPLAATPEAEAPGAVIALIRQALRAGEYGGLTAADLASRSGLAMEVVYATVGALLRAHALAARTANVHGQEVVRYLPWQRKRPIPRRFGQRA